MERLPYVIVAMGASFLAIVAAIRFASRHHEARSKVAVVILFGSVIWLLGSALEFTIDSLPTKLFFSKLEDVGVLVLPTGWFVLSMLLSGHERWVTRSNLVKLGIVPLVTLLLVFTNESHGLIFSRVALDPVDPFLPLNVTPGWGYWLLEVGYSYVVLLTAVVIFARRALLSRSFFVVKLLLCFSSHAFLGCLTRFMLTTESYSCTSTQHRWRLL
jgi:hypothetical protein